MAATSSFEHDVPLYIAGEHRDAHDGRHFTRTNPVSGAVVTRAAAACARCAREAVDAAANAFTDWAALGPAKRREYLQMAAQALADRKEALVRAMMEETAATKVWSQFNVDVAIKTLSEAAALTTQVSGQVIPSEVPGNLALAVREPAGVVVGIAPWNAPIILGVRAVAVPLACGNTVVFKGSEMCPRTHALIVDAFVDAKLPPGVLNYLSNDPTDAADVVNALIDHPAVRRVNFTGSTKVGRIIGERCARQLKPAVLELGGKAPFVVLADADLDAAVDAGIFGAFLNSGQICMSTERFIVEAPVADAFVEALAMRIAKLPAGDPSAADVVVGAVIDHRTVERCNALIDDALAKGARLVAGGKADSVLMPATLLDHVTQEMAIFHEESFGPVKMIARARNEAHAIELANDSDYGLSAAVFSGDVGRGFEVAKQIRSGICHVNGPTVHDEPQMPFGGVKDSGYGRFGGQYGIDAFTEVRWLTLPTTPRHYPF